MIISISKTTLNLVADHTVDNVLMSSFYNFCTDNIVVCVFDWKSGNVNANVINLFVNSDINNNDNATHSVILILSSSIFSSQQIIEHPKQPSIPLVLPNTTSVFNNLSG